MLQHTTVAAAELVAAVHHCLDTLGSCAKTACVAPSAVSYVMVILNFVLRLNSSCPKEAVRTGD